MVCVVTGAAVAAVPVLTAVGAGTAVSAGVAATGVVALEGAGVGTAIVALGEGACVGIGALGGGSSAGIAFATLVGPIGWAVVGCDNTNGGRNGDGGYTWDCWKPVVRDASTRPSCGMTLRCLVAHPNVQSVSLDKGGLLVGNVFGERFRLAPVDVEGTLAFHASIFSS